jgi:peptidyl-prolyl cis-trans isomerase B (cyclophilin B)
VPTEKQRREAARRHLERQLQRRQEREAARKRYTLIASIAGTLVLVAVIVVVVVMVGGSGKKSSAGSGAPSDNPTVASPSPTPVVTTQVSTISRTTGPCGYPGDTTGNTALKNVGFPPDPKPTPTTTRVVTFNSNKGVIKLTLNPAFGPCNVQSIAYLVGKKLYDGTHCFRLVTTGIFVLQCGDPANNGQGGPSYTTKDEDLTKASFKAGVVAMANSGANTNGSQFFIITKDLPAGSLGQDYTELGTITTGMNLVSEVAAGGENDANGAGDGAPKVPLSFTTVTVAPPVTGTGTPTSAKTTQVATITPSATAS